MLIGVTDTGCGMPAQVMARAFDPFFTTRDVGKGTGLGLSQVYGFVKQSGGYVKICSEAGQGTTVKVYLPRHDGPEDGGGEDEATTERPLGKSRETVLVVEDEPAVRQFSVDALGELGYRVLAADGAASALRPARHASGGRAALHRCRHAGSQRAQASRRGKAAPARHEGAVHDRHTRDVMVDNAVLGPPVELIGKPFRIKELAARMRAVLDAPAIAATGA